MKNRKLILIVSLVLAMTMSLGGTLAYLTDTDADVNTMTLGNVKIEQLEYERVVDENGEWVSTGETDKYGYTPDELKEFEQNKPLLPAVFQDGMIKWDDRNGENKYQQSWGQVGASGSNQLFDDSVKNVVDKFVFVKNTGKTDAYVRTIFAFELGDIAYENFYNVMEFNNGFDGGDGNVGRWKAKDIGVVEIDGCKYVLTEAIYIGATSVRGTAEEGILKAGVVSYPSLMQVYMKPEATNEDVEAIDGNGNGTYDILVVSQAVQAAGFVNAEAALDAAFGDVTVKSHPWNDQEPAIQIVSAKTSEELATAIANNEEAVINLTAGEYTTNLKVAGGKDITITGTKDTVLSGQIATTSSEEGTLTLRGVTVKVDDTIVDSTGISQTGKSAIAIWGNQTVICENVTFDMSLANSTAITSWWDTGIGTSIIVKNCTFNCNGQRPIRATGNVTVENCTFNDPYRYAVQLTAKASTATELEKAIVNFKNNTIVNGVNGKDFVYGIQLEGADYGCNNLVINGAGNTIVNGGTESTMYYCECGKVDHDTIEWNVETPAVHEVPQP